MQSTSTPLTTETPSAGQFHTTSSGSDDRACDHDPLTLYAANSPEYMLRWPIFNRVITDAEKHIRSFLLDSLDQPQSSRPPSRQVGVGSLLDDIPHLCRKYLILVHRRNPVVDIENLERYAREVTVQGLGWDGPSCQVVRCSEEFRLEHACVLMALVASSMRSGLLYLDDCGAGRSSRRSRSDPVPALLRCQYRACRGLFSCCETALWVAAYFAHGYSVFVDGRVLSQACDAPVASLVLFSAGFVSIGGSVALVVSGEVDGGCQLS